LLKNTGFFRFTNIAGSAGVALNTTGQSAISADFNGDGYADIYVVNQGHPNKLYINNKNETFRDVTAAAGVGFTGQGLQAVAADYDGDGDIDILLVNEAGPVVLYRNQGNLKFQSVAGAAGIAGPRNVQSASFTDINNDGYQDLIIVQKTGGNLIFKNNGVGKFVRVTNVDLSGTDNGSASATGDVNGDGISDLILGDGDGGLSGGDSFYQNSGGAGSNWLVLTLQGTTANRAAIGAFVFLKAGVITQGQQVSGGNGQNQESLPLEFGLGVQTQADTITISWPDGKFQTLTNVAANQKLTVVEQ
jgi:enediyne biosynthesis protein E4